MPGTTVECDSCGTQLEDRETRGWRNKAVQTARAAGWYCDDDLQKPRVDLCPKCKLKVSGG